jgi:hypothetical protein
LQSQRYFFQTVQALVQVSADPRRVGIPCGK